MAYAKQRGRGKNGDIQQGDIVRLPSGIVGEVFSFGGGSHQYVTVKTESGYTYTEDTRDTKKLK